MTVLRNLALTGVAFGGSWGGAIWFWRETNRMPASSELALYMLVLPLALLAAWWLGRKAWDRVSVPAMAGGAATPLPAAAEPPAAAPLPPALAIAATAVRAPHGDSVAELRAALAGNRARPGLDPELYDDDGYPILSARLPEAGHTALREELEQWRRLQALDDPRFDLAQWRALSAASAVLTELVAHACSHPQLAAWLDQQHLRMQGRLPPDAVPAAAPPALRIQALWPDEWRPAQRQLATQWLRHLASEAGWPQQLLAAPEQDNNDDAGRALAALLAHCSEARQPCLAIVIAAGSHLSEEGVSRLANQDALFTSARPQGLIPGEGAAGLLLADAAGARLDARSVLQAVATGRRASSADDVKRDTDTSLAAIATQVLHDGQASPEAIAVVTADTGHRTSRVTELMRVVTAAMPQLDPGADVIGVGASCGSCGAVTWLTALAVADAEAQDRAAPVLCVGNEDPYRRYAALLRPALAA
jgi:hypothetical protein